MTDIETPGELQPYVAMVAALHNYTSSRASKPEDLPSLARYLDSQIARVRLVPTAASLSHDKQHYEISLLAAVIVSFAAVCARLGSQGELQKAWDVLAEFQISPRAGIALALTVCEDIRCQVERCPCPFDTKRRFGEIRAASWVDLPPVTAPDEEWCCAIEVQLQPDATAQLLYTPLAVPPAGDLTFLVAPISGQKPRRAHPPRQLAAMLPQVLSVREGSACTLSITCEGTRAATFVFAAGEIVSLVTDDRLALSIRQELLPLRALRQSRDRHKWRYAFLRQLGESITALDLSRPFAVLVGTKKAHVLQRGNEEELALARQWQDFPASKVWGFWWDGQQMQVATVPQVLAGLERLRGAPRLPL